MIISNDEARIRAWIKLQQERNEGIIQLTSGDVKKLLEIIDNLRLGCPFDRLNNLRIEDPCPVCGDDGMSSISNCINNKK